VLAVAPAQQAPHTSCAEYDCNEEQYQLDGVEAE
jgi:hypothetical protein